MFTYKFVNFPSLAYFSQVLSFSGNGTAQNKELLSVKTKDNIWDEKTQQIPGQASNKSFDLHLNDKLEQSDSFLKTNLSPVAGRLSKEFSFSNLFFPRTISANKIEIKNENPEITSFFTGPFFSSSRTSRSSDSNDSIAAGSSAGNQSSGQAVINLETSNPQSSLGSDLNNPFRVPKVPKKSNRKSTKGKKDELGSSLLDFRSIFQRHLGPNSKERQEENFDFAMQYPFPRASPYSSKTTMTNVESQVGEISRGLKPESSFKDLDICPAVRKGSQDVVSSSVPPNKSFFDFFEVNWNEKSPDHCKEISRQVVISVYLCY